jgi:hypothetical protein
MSSAAKGALAHRVRRASVAFQHCNGHILTVIEELRLRLQRADAKDPVEMGT